MIWLTQRDRRRRLQTDRHTHRMKYSKANGEQHRQEREGKMERKAKAEGEEGERWRWAVEAGDRWAAWAEVRRECILGARGWAQRPADTRQQVLSSDLPVCTVNRHPQRAWALLLGTCATRVRRAAQGFSSWQHIRLASCAISQPYSGGLILPPSSCISSGSQTRIRAGWAPAGGFSFFEVTSAICS